MKSESYLRLGIVFFIIFGIFLVSDLGFARNQAIFATITGSNNTFVNNDGDIMTGDLNMSNNSILDVDVIYVHNITGRSPIFVSDDLILSSNLFAGDVVADTFTGLFNGTFTGDGSLSNATLIDATINGLFVNDAQIDLNGSLIPFIASTYNLGSPSNPWNRLYVENLISTNISGEADPFWFAEKVNYYTINETDDADDDTKYNSGEIYINEILDTFYFNETKLNSTVDNLGFCSNGVCKGSLNVPNDLFVNGSLFVPFINATNIVVSNLSANFIEAVNLVAGTIDAVNMTVDSLSAGVLFAEDFFVNNSATNLCLSNGTGCPENFTFDDIGATTLNVDFINASNIVVNNLSADFVQAVNLVAGTIDAVNMTVDTLSASVLFADDFFLNGSANDLCLSNGSGCQFNNLSLKYLYNASNTIFFNETTLNNTINQLTGIFEENITITLTGGTGTAITTECCGQGVEILDITTTPTTPTNNYRFSANTTTTTVETDRINHTGEWRIAHRGNTLFNENINLFITNAVIDEDITVRVRFRN